MKKEFPKELLTELCEEMPNFDYLIAFNAEEGNETGWRSIVRMIDANIGLQQRMARVAKITFGEADERVARANEAVEKFQGLKDRVQSFISA
jgi:hypothetical protein